ncbi:MAG: diguanylate cyclase [Eubacteriales bacterium]|nr:diguanylate cyclase [Eubacteriales bacterium]
MGKLYKRFLLISLSLFLLLTSVFVYLYNRVDNRIREEIETATRYKTDDLSERIGLYFDMNSSNMLDAADFISRFPTDEQQISEFLKSKLMRSESFSVLFFATEQNKVINTMGWIGPEGFDASTRPWYINAIERQNVVMSGPHPDLNTGLPVVSFSKVVNDETGDFLGVVGGNIDLDDISKALRLTESTGNDITVVLDEKTNKIILCSNVVSQVNFPFNAEDLQSVLEPALAESHERSTIFVKGKEAKVSFKHIENTDWTVASVLLLDDGMAVKREFQEWYIALMIIWVAAFLIQLWLIQRNVVNPLYKLENSILKLDLEEQDEYRIEDAELKELNALRDKLNSLLVKTKGYINTIQDDKKQLTSLIRDREALFKNSPNPIVIFDENHMIVDVNKPFTQVFGYKLDEIIGKELDDLLNKDLQKKDAQHLTDRIFSGFEVNAEGVRYAKDGTGIEVSITGVPILKDGQIIGGYGMYLDISDRKNVEKEILHMSYNDQLTGVYNRRFFEEEIKRLDTARNLPISIVMIDVNGLKLINDAFGHKKGDDVLIKIAQSIKESCREGEIVARYGGDEFVMLLPKTTDEGAKKIVERIRFKSDAKNKNEPIYLSFAAGIATKSEMDKDIFEILKQADDLMYEKKLHESPFTRGNLIKTLIRALYNKNNLEEEHGKRVSEMSGRVGEALGYDEEKLDRLRTLGLIHDIGKVGVEEGTLNKKESLTDQEWKSMKKHTEIGFRIVSEIEEMADLAQYVLLHHERYDGKGYPKKLRGKDIPEFARIIAVVDAFDTMTNDTAYRKRMPTREAVEELKKNSGTQFDPEIIDILIKVLLFD